jgi:transposase InsO family protein
VFLAFVIDAYGRRVVGWQLASQMRTTLVLDALRMALGQRHSGADVALVHHSDRRSQPGLNRSSQQCVRRGMYGSLRSSRQSVVGLTRLSSRRLARRGAGAAIAARVQCWGPAASSRRFAKRDRFGPA